MLLICMNPPKSSMASAVVVYVRGIITILLGGSSYQLNTQISFSSVDYTVDEDVDTGPGPPTASVNDTSKHEAPTNAPWPSEPETQTEASDGAWPPSDSSPWPQTDDNPSSEPAGWTADFQSAPSGPHSTTSLEQEFG